jgi:ABC-2 type transport system permease protein
MVGKKMNWIIPVMANQFSILASYRVDFWLKFLGKTAATFIASYFIWSAIFYGRGMKPLNGFNFSQMLYYSILAPLVGRISIADEFVGIEEDVFSGSLNRYLILPLPYGLYKFVVYLTRSLMTILQSLCLLLIVFIFDVEGLAQLILWNKILLGFLMALGGCILYFLMAGILEMVSFWQDQVWNLIVGARFVIYFTSGIAVPLSFYPSWMQEILMMTPFPYLVGIPVQFIFMENGPHHFNASVYLFWFFILISLFAFVWVRGKSRYSGVGI